MSVQTHVIKCQQCGQGFATSRYNARHCSNKCRVKAHRQPKQIAAQFERTAASVQALADVIRTKQGYRMSDQQLDTVQQMQSVLAYMVESHELNAP